MTKCIASSFISKSTVLTTALALLIFSGTAVQTFGQQHSALRAAQQERRRLNLLDPKSVTSKTDRQGYADDGRPIMYTFYQAAEGVGMTDSATTDLLNLWSESWESFGWKPVILDLSDAQKHEVYEWYVQKLEKVPVGNVGQYEKYCYLRWLAVAAAGGGWMSDYDVLPIRQFDPTFGRFTVYDHIKGTQMGMPYLVSGTQDEWDTIAITLLLGGLKHPEERLWSDMLALMNDAQGLYDIGPTKVVSCQEFLTGEEEWTNKRCAFANQFDAIHFCHTCFLMSTLKEGETVEDRPQIARDLIQSLRVNCDGPVLNPNRPLVSV